MYYSELSKSQVNELEALKQIIDLCDRWYQLAHPPVSLDQYLKNHPDLLNIEQWTCFRKIG
jgi:hypothetical protein